MGRRRRRRRRGRRRRGLRLSPPRLRNPFRRRRRRRRRRPGKQWRRRGKKQLSSAKRMSMKRMQALILKRRMQRRARRSPKRRTINALYLVWTKGSKGVARLKKARRRQLRRWFGRNYIRKIKSLTRRQLRRGVNNAGVWDPRKLSNVAQEALGLVRAERNMLTGQVRYIRLKGPGRRPSLRPWQNIQKQKREMRVKVRSLKSDRKKFAFGLNRLRLLENLATRNTSLEFRRGSYPSGRRGGTRTVEDILQGRSSWRRKNWRKRRLGSPNMLRRTKKLVLEHGDYRRSLRAEPGQFVKLSGRAYSGRYHRFADGTLYSGSHPFEGSAVLIPRSQYEENMEIYQELYKKTRGRVRRINR